MLHFAAEGFHIHYLISYNLSEVNTHEELGQGPPHDKSLTHAHSYDSHRQPLGSIW